MILMKNIVICLLCFLTIHGFSQKNCEEYVQFLQKCKRYPSSKSRDFFKKEQKHYLTQPSIPFSIKLEDSSEVIYSRSEDELNKNNYLNYAYITIISKENYHHFVFFGKNLQFKIYRNEGLHNKCDCVKIYNKNKIFDDTIYKKTNFDLFIKEVLSVKKFSEFNYTNFLLNSLLVGPCRSNFFKNNSYGFLLFEDSTTVEIKSFDIKYYSKHVFIWNKVPKLLIGTEYQIDIYKRGDKFDHTKICFSDNPKNNSLEHFLFRAEVGKFYYFRNSKSLIFHDYDKEYSFGVLDVYEKLKKEYQLDLRSPEFCNVVIEKSKHSSNIPIYKCTFQNSGFLWQVIINGSDGSLISFDKQEFIISR